MKQAHILWSSVNRFFMVLLVHMFMDVLSWRSVCSHVIIIQWSKIDSHVVILFIMNECSFD